MTGADGVGLDAVVVPTDGVALDVLGAEDVEACLCWAGFGAGFRFGTAALPCSAVTEALGAASETAGASATLLCEDDVDLVPAPIANAAANGITTARPSSSHRHRTADDFAIGAKAPISRCTAAPLSICSLPPNPFAQRIVAQPSSAAFRKSFDGLASVRSSVRGPPSQPPANDS